MSDQIPYPDSDRLYKVASVQGGHFTTSQAADAGYSPQLLAKYLKNGRMLRVYRGVYRLKYFPAVDYENLVVFWLWSERAGVFSHETALSLHGLSDVLPSKGHMTLPLEWKKRRLRVPKGLVLHYGDIPKRERNWQGPVPVTAPARTLNDCADEYLSPEHIEKARDEGLRRGLFTRSDIVPVKKYLARFRGDAA